MKRLVVVIALMCASTAVAELPWWLDNVPAGENPAIEYPEEPTHIQPAPPYLCLNGSVATCNPVRDWYCDPILACIGRITVSVTEVYAPAQLSPLNMMQPWYDHWAACREENKKLKGEK